MAKDFSSEDDVRESEENLPSSSGNNIKIPENVRTPIYILSSKFQDGYVHWLDMDGNRQRIPCGGGEKGNGFAPDECDLCAFTLATYNEAKKIEKSKGSKDKKVEALRELAGDVRGKFEAQIIVAAGELVREKTGKKDKKNKAIYRMTADFEDAKVGVLSLTKAQHEDLLGLRKNDEYPFIETGADLINRPIVLDKKKRDNARYATTKFIPSKAETDKPEIEDFDEDEYDLDEAFTIDPERISKAAAFLAGEEVEEEDLDDEELDDDDSDEDDVDDDFLNEDEDDEDESDDDSDDDEEDDEGEDEDDEDDDILDDEEEDEEEDEEPEPEPPKKTTRRTTKKTTKKTTRKKK